MNDQSIYEILIKFGLEDQQAKQAQAALQNLDKSTTKLTDSEKEGAKAAEKSALGHRELHQILHLIGHEAGPEAEAALAGLASAATGEIILLVLALRAVFEWIDKIRKAHEEQTKAAQQAWIDQRDAIRAANDEAQDFQRTLQKTRDITLELKNAFDGTKAALDAQVAGHKAILDALEKEQLAEAQGDKAKEDAIKKRFEDLKREYDIHAETISLMQQRRELDLLQAQGPGLSAAAAAADAALRGEMTGGASASQSRLKAGSEQDLMNKVRAAQENLAEVIEIGGKQEWIDTANKELTAAQEQLAAYRADQKIVREHTQRVKDLTKAKDDAIKAVQDNKSAVDEQTQKLKTAGVVLDQHRQTASAEQMLADLTALGGKAGLTAALDAGKFTPQLEKFLQDSGLSNQIIIEMIKSLADSHVTLAEHLKLLKIDVDASIARVGRAMQ